MNTIVNAAKLMIEIIIILIINFNIGISGTILNHQSNTVKPKINNPVIKIANNSLKIEIGNFVSSLFLDFARVNSNKISSPYKILAIGDKTYLESALNIKNGYVNKKKKKGYTISVQDKNNIRISKYSKEISLKYIEK